MIAKEIFINSCSITILKRILCETNTIFKLQKDRKIKILLKIFYYFLLSSFFINSAKGEIIIEVHPLMPLNPIEIKSLNTFSDNVFLLTGGDLRFQIAMFDSSMSAVDKLNKTSNGLYSAAFGHTHQLSDKHPAAILFGAPPVIDGIEFDNTTFFSWYYSAGGLELYDELWDELDLNIKAFILQTSGPRALGWFREPFVSLKDLDGKRLRDFSDFTNAIHEEIGLSIVPLKSADIIPELEKKKLDAVSWCCPLSDLRIGIYGSLENYYLQGISKNILNSDLYLNRDIYKKLPLQQKKAIELASSASILQHSSSFVYENGIALKELVEDHNVILHETPKEYFEEYNKAVTKFLIEKAETDDFFAKVWQSQKDFAIVGLPYWLNLQRVDKESYD